MSPRTGRPPKDNTMDNRIQIRLDNETLEKLDKCAEAKKTTRSDVIRTGIDLMEKQLKKK